VAALHIIRMVIQFDQGRKMSNRFWSTAAQEMLLIFSPVSILPDRLGSIVSGLTSLSSSLRGTEHWKKLSGGELYALKGMSLDQERISVVRL